MVASNFFNPMNPTYKHISVPFVNVMVGHKGQMHLLSGVVVYSTNCVWVLVSLV
jgi:hypothetical protein